MRLLLDTHVILWWMDGSSRLGPKARSQLSNTANQIHVSSASIWELALKAFNGRIRLRVPTSDNLLTLAARHGFVDLPVTTAHAAAVLDVPSAITDPFDRLIVAQARVENLRLLTADSVLLDALPGLLDAGA